MGEIENFYYDVKRWLNPKGFKLVGEKPNLYRFRKNDIIINCKRDSNTKKRSCFIETYINAEGESVFLRSSELAINQPDFEKHFDRIKECKRILELPCM